MVTSQISTQFLEGNPTPGGGILFLLGCKNDTQDNMGTENS